MRDVRWTTSARWYFALCDTADGLNLFGFFSGDIERLQKYWLAGACHKKSQQRGTSSHTLGILNFTSAFILLGGGVVLGSILLFLEHFYFRFGRKSLRKWDKCGCCSLVSLVSSSFRCCKMVLPLNPNN